MHPVMFVSEYLRLRGVNDTMESGPGWWGGEEYHRGHQPTSHTIDYRDYDPSEIIRVDNYNPEHWEITDTLAIRVNETLYNRLQDFGRRHMSLDEARSTIAASIRRISNPDELMAILRDAGWEILHTWSGAAGGDNVKWVVKPEIDVAPREYLRGFVQDYGSRTEEVLYVHGEIHQYRKPGSLRFTSIKGARQFASLVLHDIQATYAVQRLAARIIHRMDSLTGGRVWLAAQ